MAEQQEQHDHPQVELFPLWEEHDIHRVWLFHRDEPGVLFGLLVNLSRSGGCLIMHKQDRLPAAFRLGLLDQHDNGVLELDIAVTEQWQTSYFAGFNKVSFKCPALPSGLAKQFAALITRLANGEIEYLRCRIEPLAETA
jgi:hypothetical protein